jgi:hypothetical protein
VHVDPAILGAPAALAAVLPDADGWFGRVFATKQILGANGFLTTARLAGLAGNDITLALVGAGAVSDGAKSLATAEVGKAISVQLATSASAKSTLTKQDVVVTARAGGVAGDSIAPVFVGVGAVSDGAKALALTDTANAPSVQLATSAAVKSTVTKQGIVFTAKTGGVAGDGISIELVDPGETHTLSFSADGTALVATLGYAAGAITTTRAQLLAALPAGWRITATGTGADLLTAEAHTHLASGADSAITSITSAVATCLNASTQVTATGGTGATATAEASFNLEGGADSEITSTTAEVRAEIATNSLLATASGGNATVASAVAATALTGGVDGTPIDLGAFAEVLDMSLSQAMHVVLSLDGTNAPANKGCAYGIEVHRNISARGSRYAWLKEAATGVYGSVGCTCWPRG